LLFGASHPLPRPAFGTLPQHDYRVATVAWRCESLRLAVWESSPAVRSRAHALERFIPRASRAGINRKKAAQVSGLKYWRKSMKSNGPCHKDRHDYRKALWGRGDIDLSL